MPKTNQEVALEAKIKDLEESLRQKTSSLEYWSERVETSDEERKALRQAKDKAFANMETTHRAELSALRLENSRLWHMVRMLTADKTVPMTITDKQGNQFPIDPFPGAQQPAEEFINHTRY